jgi:hypothetical protein
MAATKMLKIVKAIMISTSVNAPALPPQRFPPR